MNEIWIPKWRGVTEDGITVWGYLTPSRNNYEGWYIQPVDNIPFRVIPESLAMQTGLTDANGVDIYGSMPGTRGGDVYEIRQQYGWNDEDVTVEVCEFQYGRFSVSAWTPDEPVADVTVIGNAYLNPELLEVAE